MFGVKLLEFPSAVVSIIAVVLVEVVVIASLLGCSGCCSGLSRESPDISDFGEPGNLFHPGRGTPSTSVTTLKNSGRRKPVSSPFVRITPFEERKNLIPARKALSKLTYISMLEKLRNPV